MLLGLDGSEILVQSRYMTFCNLCSRQIVKGEDCMTWRGKKFFIHTDCSSFTDRLHKKMFLKEVKRRKSKKKKV